MDKIATILIETKGSRIEECKKHIDAIKKSTKGIVTVRVINQTSDKKTAALRSGKPDFLVEVKLDKKTNLEIIRKKLEDMSWDVKVLIPAV